MRYDTMNEIPEIGSIKFKDETYYNVCCECPRSEECKELSREEATKNCYIKRDERFFNTKNVG